METIKRLDFLEPDRQAVERAAVAAVETDAERLIQAYVNDPHSFGGHYVCADLFKEQFEAYSASNESRGRYVDAVHNASAVLASEQFRRIVMEGKADAGRDKAIFLTGIPGAGKTSLVMGQGEFPADCHIIYEGQLARPEPGIAKIQQALDAGLKPEIVVVHPLPENALSNTFKRFNRIGRGSSVEVMAQIQGKLPDGLKEIHRRFGDNVILKIQDYRDRNHPIMLKGWEHLELLRSEGNYEHIRQRLETELERQRNVIGEAAYRQTKGLPPLDDRGMDCQLGRSVQTDVSGRSLSEGSREAYFLKAEKGRTYEGTVIGLDEKRVLQQTSGGVVAHERQVLSGKNLNALLQTGQNVSIRYPCDRVGIVRSGRDIQKSSPAREYSPMDRQR